MMRWWRGDLGEGVGGPVESGVRVRASVILLDDRRRVLLVRQFPNGDFWLPPGGGAEPGENSRQAAAREAKEEAGLDVEVGRLLWVTEGIQHWKGRAIHHINFIYLGRVVGGDPEAGEHASGYFARDAMPSDNIGLPTGFWDALDAGFAGHDPGVCWG